MNKRAFVLIMALWLTLSATASAWYDPSTRAFLSRDPIREAGGINLYAYCENDPIGNFDPIGLLTQEERNLLTLNNQAAADILARYGGPNVHVYTPGDILGDDLRTFNFGLSNPGLHIPLYFASIPLDSKARLRGQFPGEGDADVALLEATRRNTVGAQMALASRGLLPRGDLQRLRLRTLTSMLDLTTIAATIPFQVPSAAGLPFIGAGLSTPLADSGTLVQSLGRAAAVDRTAVPISGGYETFYRAMSNSDFQTFLSTGRVPATTETFISPTLEFSQSYEGILMKFQVSEGTTDALMEIGVRAHGARSAGLFPNLPTVRSGWGRTSALFKPEGLQINIGLGRGTALDVFNDSIRGFEIIGINQ